MEVVPCKMPERCLKNLHFKNQGIFREVSGVFQVEKGIFKSPLLCPHPLPSFKKHCKTDILGAQNTRETIKTAVLRAFGCFAGCFSAVLPRPARHPFRLFSSNFQCRAFGTSVDCKVTPLKLEKNTIVVSKSQNKIATSSAGYSLPQNLLRLFSTSKVD